MSNPIKLEVLTPERLVFSAMVSEVQFPTAQQGYYGILPDHTPVLTPVGDGLVFFQQDDQPHCLTVFGGFAEVGPDRVTLLARESETIDQLNPEQIEREQQQALALLKEAKDEAALQAAQRRLDASLIRQQALSRDTSH
ncbi:ATP synthase F1 subunit epsilon [Holophaga foetida]|uniref:ATP synthase F1 subunit epsilon n=1 Tax=Holophaga foetida TaxID=35839 RepID=UPI00024753B8|nr:ATP synthase F1 subunit epsilon [Holophaga foetida]